MDNVILHERVIEVITRERLTGFTAHPIEITKVTPKKLREQQPIPRYYLLETTGWVDLDLKEYGDEKDGSVCPICFSWVRAPEGEQFWNRRCRYVPKVDTWDGSDFVKLGNVKLNWTLCTRRFIDLANQHAWTNFKFGENLPHVAIDYPDPNWFEKATVKIKAKYPDLFGISEVEAKKLVPPRPGAEPSSLLVPQKKHSESEEYEEKVQKLQNPRFDLIEAHFKHPVSPLLRQLYQNHEELLRWRFIVDLPLKEEVLLEARINQIEVETYSPIDGQTMEPCGPEMENYIEFASDGSEGIYCIDPRERDPEVNLFIMDGGDLVSLEVPLSEFLAAPRRINH